jgi:hypothetical protein
LCHLENQRLIEYDLFIGIQCAIPLRANYIEDESVLSSVMAYRRQFPNKIEEKKK